MTRDLTTAELIDIQVEKIHTAVLTIKLLMQDTPTLPNVPEVMDEYAPADLSPDELAAAEQIAAEEALGR